MGSESGTQFGTMTSTEAQGHLSEMQTTLGTLDGALDVLKVAGNQVKQSWAGKSANEFEHIWHKYQTDFDKMKTDLNDIHKRVTEVNNQIAKAGGGL